MAVEIQEEINETRKWRQNERQVESQLTFKGLKEKIEKNKMAALNAGYPSEKVTPEDQETLEDLREWEKNLEELEKNKKEAENDHEKEKLKKYFNTQKLNESENRRSKPQKLINYSKGTIETGD